MSDNGGQTLLALLILNNIFLAVFNLIPAFPLDGGRMLRSFLAALISHRRATSIASYVGQMLALVLGMVALLDSNFFLGLIAVFIFIGAWQEREQGRLRSTCTGCAFARRCSRSGCACIPCKPSAKWRRKRPLRPKPRFSCSTADGSPGSSRAAIC